MSARRNPYIVAMWVIGALFLMVGTFLGVLGYNALDGGQHIYDPADPPTFIRDASLAIGTGVGLSVLGTVLLVLAWAISAARFPTSARTP